MLQYERRRDSRIDARFLLQMDNHVTHTPAFSRSQSSRSACTPMERSSIMFTLAQ